LSVFQNELVDYYQKHPDDPSNPANFIDGPLPSSSGEPQSLPQVTDDCEEEDETDVGNMLKRPKREELGVAA
jgi:hypothetical protein